MYGRYRNSRYSAYKAGFKAGMKKKGSYKKKSYSYSKKRRSW